MAKYRLGWCMMSVLMNCRLVRQHEQQNIVVPVFFMFIDNLGKMLRECPIEPLHLPSDCG